MISIPFLNGENAAKLAVLAAAAVALASVSAADVKRLVVGEPPPHETGAYRPFVIPGEIAEADGLVELRKGRSLTVWCPKKVADDFPLKLESARRFVESPFLPVGPVSASYVGNAAGENLLRSLGVPCMSCDLASPRALGELQTQIVVLGAGTAERLKTPAQVAALKKALSARPLVVLPGADLSLLPFGMSWKRVAVVDDAAKDATVPDLPVFAGIRRDFQDFLNLAAGQECDIVSGGPAWRLATSPACFVHVKNRNHSIIILAVGPETVPAVARSAITRILCSILANLNVGT